MKPLILVTNDDGITAGGICALAEAVLPFGDVVVVAPDSPQSGMGHAVTINTILRLEQQRFPVAGIDRAWSTSGTPADCVKLAIFHLLDRKPDLVVSGINHGSNSSINVIYSGTMSAAVEGAVEGIPSIGFSLCDYRADADFSPCVPIVQTLVRQTLERGLPTGTCLNVNIPKLPAEDLQGIRICRQSAGYWADAFERRETPGGREYFWLTGTFVNPDAGTDTDEWALAHGYVSVVPTQFDLTAHHAIPTLNTWNLG
jgi:5'-nucleotidase